MIISKNFKEFDFTEGIVSEIKWDSNLMDLLLVVNYFWDEYKNKDLTIRFKNCCRAIFTMPKSFENVPKNELRSYVYSWYTITQCDMRETGGLIEGEIKTIDDDPQWLMIKCEEIWIESN